MLKSYIFAHEIFFLDETIKKVGAAILAFALSVQAETLKNRRDAISPLQNPRRSLRSLRSLPGSSKRLT